MALTKYIKRANNRIKVPNFKISSKRNLSRDTKGSYRNQNLTNKNLTKAKTQPSITQPTPTQKASPEKHTESTQNNEPPPNPQPSLTIKPTPFGLKQRSVFKKYLKMYESRKPKYISNPSRKFTKVQTPERNKRVKSKEKPHRINMEMYTGVKSGEKDKGELTVNL